MTGWLKRSLAIPPYTFIAGHGANDLLAIMTKVHQAQHSGAK